MLTTYQNGRISSMDMDTIENVDWGHLSELGYGISETVYHNKAQNNDVRVSTNGEGEELEIAEEPVPYKLPYFKACLFSTILEDVIPQLRILDACNTQLQKEKTISEMTVLLADKFGVERKSAGDELDEIDKKNLNCMKYKLDKLQADRQYILRVISETYQNLCIERVFQTLADSVNEIVQKRERLYHLTEEDHNNKMLRRETNRQLRQLRNHIKSVTYDTNSEIEFLKSQVEKWCDHLKDCELIAQTRDRYVAGWQRSRTEQQLQTLYDKEIVPTRAINELKQKVEQEQRVHAEIELLTTININEVLEKVEEWMAKYEKDMESIDLKIQIMKNDYENILNKNQHLEETIKEHAESMNNWITFKEEREAARVHREKMQNAAIIIQAWWRGLLVRNQLGPYKPVKKKGAASKNGDKSKKKK